VAAGVNHVTQSAWASFALSTDGAVLTYQETAPRTRRLTWFDRSGTNLGSIGPERDFGTLRLAPNGKQAAAEIPDPDSGNDDIWLIDLATGGLTRLTSHPAQDWAVTWAPDSAELVFASDRNGASSVYRKATNGGSDEELLLRTTDDVFPRDLSADGRFLSLGVNTVNAWSDIWALPLFGDGKAFPLVQTGFAEDNAIFSPDGQWIAYESNESGAAEVYVRPFARSGKLRISTGGGQQIRWRRNGRELFYITPSGELMAVTVNTRETFEAGAPSTLFRACTLEPGSRSLGRALASFDVTPDGLRFLMPCADPESRPSSVTVVVHWIGR
jgi:dipeptidyl aminopeptidase/acylaminoacyl peptidase